jgi:hypothetical protein
MTTLNAELQEAVRQAQGEPIRVEDPQTNTRYVLVREDVYDRVKALLQDDPPTIEEQKAYLSHMVKITGWDDPEMDIYDDMK